MSHGTCIFHRVFAYCALIGIPYGVALVGKNVRTAGKHDFPFAVSISLRAPTPSDHFENHHHCTGTLVGKRTILTAAVCLKGKSLNDVEIIAGNAKLPNGRKYYPESWRTYAEWINGNENDRKYHNIAIITLKHAIVVSNETQPISVGLVETNELNGKELQIVGWGKNSLDQRSGDLKRAMLKVISHHDCTVRGQMVKGKSFAVPSTYFCTSTEPAVTSTCGDAGAPLFRRAFPIHGKRVVVGINLGDCPTLSGHNPQLCDQKIVNIHLNLYIYQHFIEHFLQ